MRFSVRIIVVFIVLCSNARGQNSAVKRNIVILAHEQRAQLKEFTKTKNESFYVKLYTVETPSINKTQHWFLQILDKNTNYLNYNVAVALDGYLKNNPTIKFNYMGPVVTMCDEGKFVIGFVKVKQQGIWTLNVNVKNGDIEDTVSLNIMVEKSEE